RVIEPGAKVIVIAEDDSEIALKERAVPTEAGAVALPPATLAAPERVLMVGWNRRGPLIALELSRYVPPGSLLTIAADTPELEQDFERLVLAGDNLRVELRKIDTGRRASISAWCLAIAT